MRLLLDSHTFLWLITGDPRLPDEVRQAVVSPKSQVWLSSVTVWEAGIKQQLSKLALPEAAGRYLPRQRALHGIEALPLDEAATAHLARLPMHHRDPFDRMLICQSLEHGMWLVTQDAQIALYPVRCFWG